MIRIRRLGYVTIGNAGGGIVLTKCATALSAIVHREGERRFKRIERAGRDHTSLSFAIPAQNSFSQALLSQA